MDYLVSFERKSVIHCTLIAGREMPVKLLMPRRLDLQARGVRLSGASLV